MFSGDLNGKESTEEGRYVDMYLIHFDVQKKLTQHFKQLYSKIRLKKRMHSIVNTGINIVV